jgi:REP element-mobilizing transposase RayT
MAYNPPVGYLITIRTYGTWLHGDERGSVDRQHNQYDTPLLAPNVAHEAAARRACKHPALLLTPPMRRCVDQTIIDVCDFRRWTLHERNVRSNHAHVVVTADQTPERVMLTLKARCTLLLRRASLVGQHQEIWADHGSTKYLWNADQLRSACRYVLDHQAEDLQ